ncbi:hypothetical protein ACWEKR_06245 [Nocardia sp. NPDC004573]
MATPEPLNHKTFVQADGAPAEFMCRVQLLALTVQRAGKLLYIHRHHHPDECIVHLEVAYLLLVEDGD